MIGYWVGATCLVLFNAVFVALNILMLPGNWLMVGSLAVFIFFAGPETGPGWVTLGIVVSLAVTGEILELFTGSAKAHKKGASRRAMALSLLLSMAGSVAGAFLVPIPVIGNAIGAIIGAAVGAFSGAWLGEAWKGTDISQRSDIGTAAMTGRMLGMAAKLAVGVAIFVVQFISLVGT